jgi:hypothetical protein
MRMVNGIVFIAPSGLKASRNILFQIETLLTVVTGPRTQTQRYQALCQKDHNANIQGRGKSENAAFVHKGLSIEADR